VQRRGSSTAPIVVNGRTITLRARTWTVPLSFGDTQMWFVHARPDHVEVLEADGRHRTLRVHDVTYTTRLAVLAGSALAIAAARARRRRAASDAVAARRPS
jgi:hypothetical protein